MSTRELVDFWDKHPCNANRGKVAAGDEAYFDRIRMNKERVEPHIIPFMDLTRWYGKQVLDVGCGLGTQAIWFAMQGAWVTGCDFSLDSLALAERHKATIPENVGEHVLLKMVDFDCGIYPRQHYDLIWAWGSLHHMQTPARNLRGLRAHCAKADTVLKLMVYHRDSLKVWRLMAIYGQDWRRWTESNGPVPVSDAYTLSQAIRMVELAGWQVTSAKVDHIFPWSIKHYKQGKYVKAIHWRWMPEKLFRRLEQKWGFHILIEARPR